MGIILHITTYKAWRGAIAGSGYRAPSLEAEGFIHCSTVDQTADTANLFFRGQMGLVLLCIDEDKLEADVKYEPAADESGKDSRPDQLFPHVYGPLNVASVIRVVDFPPNEDGSFAVPSEVGRLARKSH